jgi:hypothetical protein
VIELTEWFRATPFPAKPWLMVGKGPTFDRRGDYDLAAYNTLGLNHVVRELSVDVAHAIDIDVVGDNADRLAENAEWLLVPRNPHLRSKKTERLLEEWFDEYPVLRDFDARGRLVWYNLAGTRAVDRSPMIGAHGFSSQAALNVLGLMGVDVVRSLGIDGGRSYSQSFKELESTTMLENGAASYDAQFDWLRSIADEHGIDYRPLVEPLRIFVGTDESQIVAHRVLEYTIRKASSIPIEFTPLLNVPHRMPRDPKNRPRTKFSFCRFVIPERCGFRGRALYLDSDMIVFGDIAELAELPFGTKKILCSAPKPTQAWDGFETSYLGSRSVAVLLLDCEHLPWDADKIVAGLDEGRYTYDQLLSDLCIVEPDEVDDTIAPEWNDLERFDADRTKLLHFTVVPTQPWKNDDNPLGEIWMEMYREAVEAGAVPPEEVEWMIDRGLAKPSLRPALRLAPSRRSSISNASLEIASARERISDLEQRITAMERSLSWRLGSRIVRVLHAPTRTLRKNKSS